MDTIVASNYSVIFQKKGFIELDKIIQENNYSSVFLFVDSNTNKNCTSIFEKLLIKDFKYTTIEVSPGEEAKNLDTCTYVWEKLSENGADRKSLLINLGGGVITDMGGFIASTFKRGIDFINIPTTLLAMADASIGGKTGVDFKYLKNQIGIITDPKLVIIDTEFLKTLPSIHYKSGLSEILKHALIHDKSHWQDLILNIENDKFDVLPYISKSIQIKNQIVSDDPFEENKRKVLNFGHTIGHAIESHFMDSYHLESITHGQSIAIGMIIEAHISIKACSLDISSVEKIKSVFISIFGKEQINKEDQKQIVSLLKHDKKNAHGHTNFALLKGIGVPQIDVQVNDDLIYKGFDYYSC
ncbi:MAG: 3-dehydroquinate synthase [Flavobacteriaceae bacterium]|nr:3-dehydroquinate synthase [Flavobacteriaceae bacterium]|tara:strand:+ start:306 stop:1373 length:1068 start_codon:yes stop_codon:yes gene_type:complete